MKRRDFITLIGGAAVTLPLTAKAQQLIGAWRATNQCFLAAFLHPRDGRTQALYLSGERDNNATWTLDDGTLRITSQAFPLDRFAGHLTNDRIEADYVWHDLAKDELNQQSCIFERFTPRRGARRSGPHVMDRNRGFRADPPFSTYKTLALGSIQVAPETCSPIVIETKRSQHDRRVE